MGRTLPPLLRDLVLMTLGAYGFIYQVRHGAEVVLMAGCIALLGGPLGLAALRPSPATQASVSSSVSLPSSLQGQRSPESSSQSAGT